MPAKGTKRKAIVLQLGVAKKIAELLQTLKPEAKGHIMVTHGRAYFRQSARGESNE